MRVVADTNVVVSRYVAPHGIVVRILNRWQQNAFDLLVSEAILAEYQRVLAYPRLRARHGLSDEQISAVVDDFREIGLLIEPEVSISAVEDDPDDDKFLECAVAGGAEYIVTGDSHLLNLKQFQGIQILSPAAFLAFLDTLPP